jgi:hypothetical protein
VCSRFETGSPGSERVGLRVDEWPVLGNRWSVATSFVLAALRALHIDSSGAVRMRQ